jgi:hypothetical protein
MQFALWHLTGVSTMPLGVFEVDEGEKEEMAAGEAT